MSNPNLRLNRLVNSLQKRGEAGAPIHERSRNTLVLSSEKNIIFDADGGQLSIKDGGHPHFLFDCDATALTIHDDTNSADGASITVAANGVTTIATNDNDGTAGHLVLNPDGNVGIGTSTPGGTLHATGASAEAWGYSLANTANDGHGLLVQGGGTEGTRYILQLKVVAGNYRMTVHDTGEVYIAGDSALITLDATGAGDKDSVILFKNEAASKWLIKNEGADNRLAIHDYSDSSEAVHIDPGDASWSSGSDSRIKKDVSNMSSSLSLINNLRAVTWKRKYGKLDKTYPGLVAQEVSAHFPLVVRGTEDSFQEITLEDGSLSYTGGLSIAYSEFIPYLIKAIQELSAKFTALENA